MARRKRADAPTEEEQHGFIDGARDVEEVHIPEFMDQTQLPYAWSVIRDRALVDSRDGLKPVQRRILWTLFEDGVLPNKEYVKVARLAGNVLRYHPHGNVSVEDALVRMAQPYSLRVPLIDGKGSFGAHPGDEAAASRYIEARLAPTAVELLEETRSGSVRMVHNFDDTLEIPEVLPVRWPVSVINGSQGIAVGYAANMPQHNPTETLKACKLLLRKPNASVKEIMRVMPGPDFWTGGTVIGMDGVEEYFTTGKGTFTVRAKYTVEQQPRGKTKFTFTELPPFVSCDSLVDKIRELVRTNAKFKEGIASANNFTGRVNDNDVKLVVETKAGANPQEMLALLFKNTQLQTTFSVSNTVVYKGMPMQLGIRELLLEFLSLREQCVLTRSHNYKEKKEARIHQIDGLLTILLDIDAAIAIIRRSDDQNTAREKLMRKFKIDEGQANYVLDMQLRRLTKQDSTALKAEKDQLIEDNEELSRIINDKDELHKVISAELDKEIKIIGRPRMMEISGLTDDEAKEEERRTLAAIKAENKDSDTYLYLTSDGKVLKTPSRPNTLSMMRKDDSIKKPDGAFKAGFKTTTQSRLGVICSDGSELSANASFVQNGKSAPLSKMVNVPRGAKALTVVPDDDRVMLLVSATGGVRKVQLSTNGKWEGARALANLKGDRLVNAIDITNAVKGSTVIMVTGKGRVLRFDLDGFDRKPVRMGSQLIKGMKVKDGDEVVAAVVARPDSGVLTSMTRSTVKTTTVKEIPVNSRDGLGSLLHPMNRIKGMHEPVVDIVVDGAMLDQKGRVVPLPEPNARAAKPTVNLTVGAKLAGM